MAVVTISDKLDPSPAPVPIHEELQLLRMSDVVAITRLSRTKVYSLVASGDLPSVRSGKAVRVPLLALRKWIADHTVVAPTTAGRQD